MSIKVKIQIAGRIYPLTIDPEEEEFVRHASREMAQIVKNYEKNFAVKDKQDVLAMCTLHFASLLQEHKEKHQLYQDEVENRIHELTQLLDKI